ncbi:MAG: hypothetical protein LBP61_01720 [Desulfovibrio sp.]|jgi:hypothetical protein|nr:hypothetical protein [Desulfovibrio sp.]
MSQADIARPFNPAPLPEAGIYKAVQSFVLAYALPALDPANVIQGWQNRASLPPGTNDYAVISVLFDLRHGSIVETFRADDPDPAIPGVLTLRGLIEVSVQVDFCAENDTARQRARRLALVTRSSVGVRFFNERGMSALYADDARDISFVGDANQFVRRWMTTLHLTLVEGVSVNLDYFDRAKISRIENVDVHHPEKGA